MMDTLDLEMKLPVDPKITKEKMPNGIIYYIRGNFKPENRAELRLVVNAGSILEDDSQQGLAHFCEHMAFNGTENFHKLELVDYLESIGMEFGPDINAYTSFDETVYMLQIPTDSVEILHTAFQILEDWAHGITFDDEEIEKERGVIIEEWRLRRDAETRMFDKQVPILFKDSKYAKRLPIGEKTVLDTFRYETLRRFYHDWYQPLNMAIIAVGDFEKEFIERLIQKHFSRISARTDAPEREYFEVPEHQETLFAIASDPEARYTAVGLYHKVPVKSEEQVKDYRDNLVEMLYIRMFNERLDEITQFQDPPFIFAQSSTGRFVRTANVYMLNAVVRDNGIPRGMESLLLEAKRVREFGFISSELKRAKAAALRDMEKIFSERDKIRSDRLAAEYIRNYLNAEPIPGIELEYKLFKQLIPGISLKEVNALAQQWLQEKNRVVMISSPEKEGIVVPSEAALSNLLDAAEKCPVEPYQEQVAVEKLLETTPQPGTIARESRIEELDLTIYQLSNGVKVILKPTDFKNDEVLFTAFSPGGSSLVADSLIIPAETAATLISESGIGLYDNITLEKYLADKVVSISPYIDELSEGIKGSASPKDLETLFQLIYLYFTNPRADSVAFASTRAKYEGIYQNRQASPEAAYQDTVNVTLTQYHPRYKPWTVETLQEMNLKKSLQIYKDRFMSADDFTFIFVGNFVISEMKTFVQTYLGSLPVFDRQESWQDVTYDYPRGIIEKSLMKGMEPKSNSTIIFTGPFQWSIKNRLLMNALVEVLQIKLRERIREDLSGTYGVSVSANYYRYPKERCRITISFGSDPERTVKLNEEIFIQIDSLKSTGYSQVYQEKVKQQILRRHEINMKENKYWLNMLESRYFYNEDPRTILQFDDVVQQLTMQDIRQVANIYLDTDNYIKVILYPENYK
jgi:zinc protease